MGSTYMCAWMWGAGGQAVPWGSPHLLFPFPETLISQYASSLPFLSLDAENSTSGLCKQFHSSHRCFLSTVTRPSAVPKNRKAGGQG